MNNIKKIIMKVVKSVYFWLTLVIAILMSVLYILGFRITYSPNLETSWDAVSAIGQWAGAIVGVLIPIAAVYIDHILQKSKRDIGESNIELLNEFQAFKDEYSEKLKTLSDLVDDNGNINNDGGNHDVSRKDKLKEKALKFINISMVAKTKTVAEHLNINEDDVYELLAEMDRHDDTISHGGQLRKENMHNIVWTKKSK
ncbi:hypothetical protein GCM10008986_10420 [Salinibacillus aidingensis]|uniref:Uncharacterized protein n=1 Tax=Salinibacillus aidingensis TaxID=237684 RepID=A0ABN1AZ23_9BACI